MLKIILSELNKSRNRKIASAAKNADAALNIPEYLELERAAREYNYTDLELLSKKEAAAMSAKHKEILKKQDLLLKKYNLSVLPQFDCKKCGDTGYAGNALCACVKSKLKDEVRRSFGLSAHAPISFEDCDYKLLDLKTAKIYKKIQEEYCVRFPFTETKNLVFSGSAGIGKTFLACCIATDLSSRGHDVFFVTAYGLNTMFLKIHTAEIDLKPELTERLTTPTLLIIDDLGTEPMYKITLDYLYNIINERLTSGLHTLITTNLSQDELRLRYGERIWSRLNNKANSAFFVFSGKDLRQQTVR